MEDCVPSRTKAAFIWPTAALLLFAVLDWLGASALHGFNDDAGCYVGLAWAMTQGLAPYRDVLWPYPPGGPLMLSLLGDYVCTPYIALSFWYLLSLGNLMLLYLVLVERKHSKTMSAFYAGVYATITIIQDGTAIILEPAQSFFLLLALLISQKWPRLMANFSAGLSMGASLMVKQYSLLVIPALCYFALTRPDPPGPKATRPKQLGLLVAGIATPFLAFALAYGFEVVPLFKNLATFGSGSVGLMGAAAYYDNGELAQHGWATPLVRLLSGLVNPSLYLLPMIVVAIGMRKNLRDPFQATVLTCFVASLLPLLVRTYPHYAQLSTPWGIILTAEFASQDLGRFSRPRVWQAAVLVVIFPVFYHNQRDLYRDLQHSTFYGQTNLASEFLKSVPKGQKVALGGLQWLYPLTRTQPPLWRLSQVTCDPNSEKSRDTCDILALYYVEGQDSPQEIKRQIDWVEQGGLVSYKIIEYGNPLQMASGYRGKLHLFRRPKKAMATSLPRRIQASDARKAER